jgi:predicted RNA methylase
MNFSQEDILHKINEIMLFFRARAKHIYSFSSVRKLDFGCGTVISACTFGLLNPSSHIIGCDINPVNREWLNRTFIENIGIEIKGNVQFFAANNR